MTRLLPKMTDCTAHFSKIRIVLVHPTHPGNIGAVARSMKTMGFSRLYLVQPQSFPHADATARAAGADDVLAGAIITTTLTEALSECSLVIGSSARIRALSLPLLNPRQCALQIMVEPATPEIALVFGQERSGLSNAELQQCHYHLYIPTTADFSSMNLAAAVQLVLYEIRMAALLSDTPLPTPPNQEPLATVKQAQDFYQHLEQTLIGINFLDPNNKRHMMSRMQRLFNRTRLETTEYNILRGILTAIQRKIVN
ncbi:MAG: RNA methyltransferase [Gammaproteobacteria bacterium]